MAKQSEIRVGALRHLLGPATPPAARQFRSVDNRGGYAYRRRTDVQSGYGPPWC